MRATPVPTPSIRTPFRIYLSLAPSLSTARCPRSSCTRFVRLTRTRFLRHKLFIYLIFARRPHNRHCAKQFFAVAACIFHLNNNFIIWRWNILSVVFAANFNYANACARHLDLLGLGGVAAHARTHTASRRERENAFWPNQDRWWWWKRQADRINGPLWRKPEDRAKVFIENFFPFYPFIVAFFWYGSRAIIASSAINDQRWYTVAGAARCNRIKCPITLFGRSRWMNANLSNENHKLSFSRFFRQIHSSRQVSEKCVYTRDRFDIGPSSLYAQSIRLTSRLRFTSSKTLCLCCTRTVIASMSSVRWWMWLIRWYICRHSPSRRQCVIFIL